jgi:hypothetical protein
MTWAEYQRLLFRFTTLAWKGFFRETSARIAYGCLTACIGIVISLFIIPKAPFMDKIWEVGIYTILAEFLGLFPLFLWYRMLAPYRMVKQLRKKLNEQISEQEMARARKILWDLHEAGMKLRQEGERILRKDKKLFDTWLARTVVWESNLLTEAKSFNYDLFGFLNNCAVIQPYFRDEEKYETRQLKALNGLTEILQRLEKFLSKNLI